MDWILFVYKRGFKHYLVPAGCESDAWEWLARRQSISIENCKKEYKLKGTMNGNSEVWTV